MSDSTATVENKNHISGKPPTGGGNQDIPLSPGSPGIAKIALIIGIIGLALSVLGLVFGYVQGSPRPFIGWLIGGSFWLSLGIGMLFFIMIGYVFDAGWLIIIRRQLEHAVGAFKWLAIIFTPLLLLTIVGAQLAGSEAVVWPWIDPSRLLPGGETVGQDVLYQSKSPYLNLWFFCVRFVLYFVVFIGIAELLRRCSFRMDKDGDHEWVHQARFLAPVGIILCALATTFAAIDWFKSIEYHWFSTMYGVWFFAASFRAGLAAAIVLCMILAHKGWLQGLYRRAHSYYMGCLLLAFTIFWAYISFCQYFLIYNANIPEETFWYQIRELGINGQLNSWWWVSMGLIFLHFIFPFLFLVFYHNKFGARILFISIWTLVFHLLDLYWNILPAKLYASTDHGYTIREFIPSIWDITAIVGVGGICVWAFLQSAAKTSPVPLRDPRIGESIYHTE